MGGMIYRAKNKRNKITAISSRVAARSSDRTAVRRRMGGNHQAMELRLVDAADRLTSALGDISPVEQMRVIEHWVALLSVRTSGATSGHKATALMVAAGFDKHVRQLIDFFYSDKGNFFPKNWRNTSGVETISSVTVRRYEANSVE